MSDDKRGKTVGYLIGAIIQLIVGALWTLSALMGQGGSFYLFFGAFVLVLGIRAMTIYLKERRQ